jgi:hypothetical protein
VRVTTAAVTKCFLFLFSIQLGDPVNQLTLVVLVTRMSCLDALSYLTHVLIVRILISSNRFVNDCISLLTIHRVKLTCFLPKYESFSMGVLNRARYNMSCCKLQNGKTWNIRALWPIGLKFVFGDFLALLLKHVMSCQ